ncbi:hypothetical protein [Bacillus cereus]|uniref:hypothetical protein n=1 Tax=Bacillus cereus TaxID=1396 RepID=UPI00192D2E99|nr:hypothetical protein [Bacillus cereus]
MGNYYAERNGLLSKKNHTLRELRDLFVLFHNTLRKEGYLVKFYGGKDQSGTQHGGICGDNADVFCFSKTGYKGLLPIDYDTRYKEEQIFTLIEMFYTYVNHPIPFLDEFNKEEAKDEYRNRVNEILNNYGKGWELVKEGYIRELVNNGLSPLLEQSYDDSDIRTEIDKTKQEFLKYGATLDDKKDALIRLGSIMEPLREEMKNKLSKKDTSDIFQLLNEFQLRHNNVKQKTNYDKEVYYPWMFYQMLAALDAFLKIKEREQ